MIDRVIAFSIRNRGLVIVAGLLLGAWGAYAAYTTLFRSAKPAGAP